MAVSGPWLDREDRGDPEDASFNSDSACSSLQAGRKLLSTSFIFMCPDQVLPADCRRPCMMRRQRPSHRPKGMLMSRAHGMPLHTAS